MDPWPGINRCWRIVGQRACCFPDVAKRITPHDGAKPAGPDMEVPQ